MNKKILKISLFTIISIMMIFPANFSYANEPATTKGLEEFQNELRDLKAKIKGNECVKEAEDKEKVITFIEEPLYIEEAKNQKEKDINDTEIVKCFRHTLIYKSDKNNSRGFSLDSDAKNGCDKALLERTFQKNSDIIYSCKEIQVIKSQIGGTRLLYSYIGLIYKWATRILGVVTVLIIIISGIQISASAGNSDAISSAKTRIVQSISGLALLFLAGLLLNAINPNFFVA